jgi:hypothetical protein
MVYFKYKLIMSDNKIYKEDLTYLDYIQRRPPNHEEHTQIAEIIFKRTAEIRSAIFNAT